MLNGSHHGRILVIWAALIGAALTAGALFGLAERVALRRMGMA